jgi:CheY-like chemotaxis protein
MAARENVTGIKMERVKKRDSYLLLVEDDKINVDVINLFLRDYCNVDHSVSALEAIEKVKEKKYDAILMDINLKGMSGLDAVKQIRQMDEYKDTPVVAVTAYALAGDRKRFLSQGCSHYLAKPFSKNDLIDLLETILN